MVSVIEAIGQDNPQEFNCHSEKTLNIEVTKSKGVGETYAL